MTDDRAGHLHIVLNKDIDKWLNNYLKWYNDVVKEQGLMGVVLDT